MHREVSYTLSAFVHSRTLLNISTNYSCNRKRRGSSEKSSYKPASEATGLPLVPVHYEEELTQNITPNGETNMTGTYNHIEYDIPLLEVMAVLL